MADCQAAQHLAVFLQMANCDNLCVHADRQLQQFGGGAGHAGGVNGASYIHKDDNNDKHHDDGNNWHQGGDRKLLDSGAYAYPHIACRMWASVYATHANCP